MAWTALQELIEPHYPKAGNGKPPRDLSTMLRRYCVSSWFNLTDEASEYALHDIAAFRDFCRVDLGREGVPDATTLLNFRHLLEAHNLGAAIFSKVGELLLVNGLKLCGGTIVDATIIAAPSSTMNQAKAHAALDKAVDAAYNEDGDAASYINDGERVTFLFKRCAALTSLI